VRGTAFTFEQAVTYPVDEFELARARAVRPIVFQRGRRRARTRRTPVIRRTFTALPRGRALGVTYRLRRRRGRRLPRTLRVTIRQRFTLTRPGFRPLVVSRERVLRVRARRR
jgi:hypothetical protein